MERPWMVVLLFAASASCVDLQTKKGDIQGTEEISRNGRTYYAFRGIPYAQPPIGSLRFRNPQPHNGWEGKLDARESGPICIQNYLSYPHKKNMTLGKEDCLYLNIFTPTRNQRKRYPVLVYIHGGGFNMGMSGTKESSAFFMDEDIVLVSFHYRLGTLGFLSTENSVIPGNFGLKDQAMVIKWLSENIDDYGGNPNSIVVFGEGAGGASAHYLITSPLSRGLLKGAISQSGVMNSVWAQAPKGNAKKLAKHVAKIVGCNSGPTLECLQSVEAEKLITAELHFLVWDTEPNVIFRPVLEEESEEAFITKYSRNVKSKVPWITGTTNGEGLYKISNIINQDKSVLEDFRTKFYLGKILPAVLFLKPETPGFDEVTALVEQKYFPNFGNHELVLKGIEEFYRDFYFVCPMVQALKNHAGPKYAYLFTYRAEHSLADMMGPKKINSPKASHGDELLSLFDWSSVIDWTNSLLSNQEVLKDRLFSELLIKTWVHFAENQKPYLEGVETQWDEYVGNNLLNITEEPKMEEISHENEIKFCSEIFAILKPKKEVNSKGDL